jgi:hypothetical protein
MLSPSALKVWSSPDAVANWTRYPRQAMLGHRLYGDMWEQMFLLAPDFDFIALQDSQGERGQNALADSAAFLGNCSASAARQHRGMWSNIELFATWPPECQWSRDHGHCRGRAPAPISRIVRQIQTAALVLARHHGGSSQPLAVGQAVLVAWEWTSCLSPNGGDPHDVAGNITNMTLQNWRAYRRYMQGPG